MKCGAPAPLQGFAGSAGVLLLAAQQTTEDVAERTALLAAEHAAQDAAQRVVSPAASAGAAEDAAEDIAETTATTAGRLGLRGAAARRCGAPLGELLADVGQHDRRQDGQKLLEQAAAARATTGQRGGDCVAVVAAEYFRDEQVALAFIDLVDADPAVEQSAGALLGNGRLRSLESMSSAWTFCATPPTRAGTSVRMALFTSP
jgi:hypothetical protein